MRERKRTREGAERVARAERILDAASLLIVQRGYDRVTIDDIAERCGVGKGTIYLHWESREELFKSVLCRAAAKAYGTLRAKISAEPMVALLSRFTGALFRSIMADPIMNASFTGNLALMGRLANEIDPKLSSMQEATFLRYLDLLYEHGLAGNGSMNLEDFREAYLAVAYGFFTLPRSDVADSSAHRARLLELTIVAGFEPGQPDPTRIDQFTPIALAVLDEMVANYSAGARSHYE